MVYHVCNKSIAKFRIFNNDHEYSRMIEAIKYYQRKQPAAKFGTFIKLDKKKQEQERASLRKKQKLVEIIAYCLMPTHLHLILKTLQDGGISRFMNNILVSYTRFFNIKHNRKGHLWEGRSKKILIETDNQFLHLTRYIHLNPVTAHLVNKPEEWPYSSYREYISKNRKSNAICRYEDLLDIEPEEYKNFTESGINYQCELAKMKKMLLE